MLKKSHVITVAVHILKITRFEELITRFLARVYRSCAVPEFPKKSKASRVYVINTTVNDTLVLFDLKLGPLFFEHSK